MREKECGCGSEEHHHQPSSKFGREANFDRGCEPCCHCRPRRVDPVPHQVRKNRCGPFKFIGRLFFFLRRELDLHLLLPHKHILCLAFNSTHDMLLWVDFYPS